MNKRFLFNTFTVKHDEEENKMYNTIKISLMTIVSS